MHSLALDLKPRGILDLLDLAVRTYRRNFTGLLAIGAAVLVPMSIANTIGQFFFTLSLGDLQQSGPTLNLQLANTTYMIIGAAAFLASLVVMGIGWPLSEGALTISVSEQYLGRKITFGEGSPAVELGIEPIDVSGAGLPPQWVSGDRTVRGTEFDPAGVGLLDADAEVDF